MINKICTALELSAKEIHVLESFNKFNGTNFTLKSDIALNSVRENVVVHSRAKTRLNPIQECPLMMEWGMYQSTGK